MVEFLGIGQYSEFLEKFALAENRSEPLATLVAGTPEWYYFSILDLLNQRGAASKLEKLLKDFERDHGSDSRLAQLKNRFKAYNFNAKSPQKTLEWLRDDILEVRYDHYQRTLETGGGNGRDKKHPSEVSSDLVEWDSLVKQADPSNLSMQSWVVQDRLMSDPKPPRKDVINHVALADAPNLVPTILNMLNRKKDAISFGTHPIHSKLTLDQMYQLLKGRSKLIDDWNFVNQYILRLGPNADVDIERNDSEKVAYFERLLNFITTLSQAFNGLRLCLLYNWIKFDIQRGKIDEERFWEYLRIPKRTSLANAEFYQRLKPEVVVSPYSIPSIPLLESPSESDESNLVRSVLMHLFSLPTGGPDASAFKHLLREHELNRIYATAKLLYSDKDHEKHSATLGADATQQLRAQVEVTLLPHNPKFFSSSISGDISIEVELKNVPTLIVKVFEINTDRYYRDHTQEVPDDLQLDGLIANEEKVFKYNLFAPIRRHRERFDFPALSKRPRGLFIVEFIGNGRSSRCVIRKGRLGVVERIASAGHVFSIIDEENRLMTENASIWISGHQFTASDESGLILVPFTNSPGNYKMIIKAGNSDGEFASLETFFHRMEDYTLSAKFYVDREALIAGAKATVLIRATLLCCTKPASLSLLKDVTLSITTRDLDNVDSSKEVKNFKLDNSGDATFEFQVPDKLQSVEFKLAAKVRKASTATDVTLQQSEYYQLNQIDSRSEFRTAMLRSTRRGYEIVVLGKTGEAISDRSYTVSFKPRYIQQEFSHTCQTDSAGVISLPPLVDIERVSLRGEQNFQWDLQRDGTSWPALLTGLEGEVLQVPFMSSLGRPGGDLTTAKKSTTLQLRPSDVALFEIRMGAVFSNCFEKMSLADGLIQLKGLTAGDYTLHLKEHQMTMQIKIAKGVKHSEFLFGSKRALEQTEINPLQVSGIEWAPKKPLKIILANHSDTTRVHVFCTEFMPDFSSTALLDSQLGSVVTVEIPAILSSYMNGRILGDEYRYILERRYAKTYPGNTLTRPSLLLQPWAIRSTQTDDMLLQDELGFGAARAPACARMASKYCDALSAVTAGNNSDANLDFKQNPSSVLLNLRPNEDGLVVIESSKLAGSTVRIIAVDGPFSVFREVAVDPPASAYKDMRLRPGRALDATSHYAEQKNISEILPGQTFVCEDITTSKIQVFDTLSKVFSFYLTASPNPTLQEFSFVLDWLQLSEADKQEKYSKYACHELNIFIYFKDSPFFTRVVKPYLNNKKEKTFIDRWLLQEDLSDHFAPAAFSKLNSFEQVLLVELKNEKHKDLVRYFADKAYTIPFNTTAFNRLFQIALKGSALDTTDDLGIAAKTVAQEREKTGREEPSFESSSGEEVLEVPPPEAPSDYDGFGGDEAGLASADKMGMEMDRPHQSFHMNQKKLGPSIHHLAQLVKLAPNQPKFYQDLDKTQEYAETNYWKVSNWSSTAGLVPFSQFWADFAQRDHKKGFISKNFIWATSSFPEMMLALAVLDLPLQQVPEPHAVDYKESQFSMSNKKAGFVVFHKDIKKAPVEQESLMVMQNFFDPADRYVLKRGERVEKYVQDEFLRQKIYGCNVVVTNVSLSRQRAEVLLQIPVGAIAVSKTSTTKSFFVDLPPYQSERLEYYFYWPTAGLFEHFPVHVGKDERVIAFAPPIKLNVVNALTKIDTKSWDWISQMASSTEVLEYLQRENVHAVNINDIAWRMRDKDFFLKAVPILAARHVLNPTILSYSLMFMDLELVKQFFAYHTQTLASRIGYNFYSELFSTDDVELHNFEHLEHWPLVNARAHKIGTNRTILNDRFKAQYNNFLQSISQKSTPLSYPHLMAATYYLLLQDRIEEATAMFQRIPEGTFSSGAASPTTEPPSSPQKRSSSRAGAHRSEDELSEDVTMTPTRRSSRRTRKGSQTEGQTEAAQPAPASQLNLPAAQHYRSHMQLQYDYLSAYLDFYNPDPARAQAIAEQYKDYPVPRWNKMFAQIRQQLYEVDTGRMAETTDEEDRNHRHSKSASTESSIDFNVVGNEITVDYQAATACTIKIFKMDIELLFSNSPFVRENLGNFAYIIPNAQFTVPLSSDKTSQKIVLPAELRDLNIMIDISAGAASCVKPHFSHSLFVNVIENYGQVKVASRDTGKPLSRVYVKVFARHNDGRTAFYKDGYTDIRGAFDYISLNTNDLDTAQRLSILIMSEQNGARIVEATPPKR